VDADIVPLEVALVVAAAWGTAELVPAEKSPARPGAAPVAEVVG